MPNELGLKEYPHKCYGCGKVYWSLIPMSPAFSAHVSECIGNEMPVLEWPDYGFEFDFVSAYPKIFN